MTTRIRESQIKRDGTGRSARIRTWGMRGFWTMLDQGLFSAATFLVNILLARWLVPQEYGAVAMALSIYYLLLNFHVAILTEPMLIFGSGKYRSNFRKYLGMVLYGHWALSAIIALLLGLAALIAHWVGSETMAQALAGLALASPFLLLLGLSRRACYVPMRHTWPVAGSALNLVIVLGGAFMLWYLGMLSALTALVLLGAAAGVASLVLVLRLRPRITRFGGNPKPTAVRLDHYRYGRWSFLATLSNWVAGQLLLVLIPIFLGLSANAAVAAAWNLYRPINLFVQAVSLVLLPTFTRWANEGLAADEFRKRVIWIAASLSAGVILYGFILTINSGTILGWLYKGKYNNPPLIILAGIPWVVAVSTVVLTSAIKANGGIRRISLVWGIPAIMVLLSGPWVVDFGGLQWAVGLFGISYSVALVLAFVLLQRVLSRGLPSHD